jgi:methionyl-tRNA synthetase
MPKILVTTPIFYVNARPHLGHAYSMTLADVYARYLRLKGTGTLLSTGCDEHGTKVRNAAIQQSMGEQAYCDEMSPHFKRLADALNISYGHFTRTTHTDHAERVRALWEKIQPFVYKGSYEGWYSVSDECFYSGDQVLDNADGSKRSKESGSIVQWQSEPCYMFRLGHFKEDIAKWLQGDVIRPGSRRNELNQYVSELKDICISRPSSKCPWGIEVPGDSAHTVYVWLDALTGYLHPPSEHLVHFVGKDILKFHAVIWPAVLIAAGQQLPNKIFCHGHWQVNQQKMSKSVGNVVDPAPLIAQFGADAFRYCLLKNSKLSDDAEFSKGMFENTYNNELVNQLGNLVARCTSARLADYWRQADCTKVGFLSEHYVAGQFHQVIDESMELIRECNRQVFDVKPWSLTTRPEYLISFFSELKTRLFAASHNLLPVMPSAMAFIMDELSNGRGHHSPPRPLFPRICRATIATTATSS